MSASKDYDLMERTILVTGGAGYVGSHTCKALAWANYRPVTVDNLSRGHRHSVRWGPFEEADVRDSAALDRIFAAYHPAAVIHLAAFAYVEESAAKPEMYYTNNLLGMISLIEAMRRNGLSRIVFSSTCAVYGDPIGLPLTEDHPKAPVNPYGFSKLACERILADYDAAHGVKSVCLRYFNAAGADPEGEIGEAHEPETHLIPLALRAASDPDFTLSVFGTDYPTSDGTAVRDYVHVADLSAAHVLALGYLEDEGPTRALNLGTERGFSVLEVLDTMSRILRCPVKTRYAKRRAGDPPALVADSRMARRVLKWAPARSDLETIIGTAAAWHWGIYPACTAELRRLPAAVRSHERS
jgi:UDP-glucose-4-epimerase GalE